MSTPPVTPKPSNRITAFFGRKDGGKVERSPGVPIFDVTPPAKRKCASASPLSAAISRAVTAKRRRTMGEDPRQRALDVGQRDIGIVRCAQCGMAYNVDSSDDVAAHAAHHEEKAEGCSVAQMMVGAKALEGWIKKSQRGAVSMMPIGNARVVLEVSEDCACRGLRDRIVKLIEDTVNPALGISADADASRKEGGVWRSTKAVPLVVPTDSPSSSQGSSSTVTTPPPWRKAYVAIVREQGESVIVGCLLAEIITEAMYGDTEEATRNGPFMGVNRLWVHKAARRQGIARLMVEEARKRILPRPIDASRVAFSEPTEDGERFARSYALSYNARYLAYNFATSMIRRLHGQPGKGAESSQEPDLDSTKENTQTSGSTEDYGASQRDRSPSPMAKPEGGTVDNNLDEEDDEE